MKSVLFFLFLSLPVLLAAQTDLQGAVFSWKGGQSKMLDGSTRDLSSFRVHTSTLQPGKSNHPLQAYNDVDELVIVKEGQLTVQVNEASRQIGPGGLAMIIAGDRQAFRNESGAPVVYHVLTYKSKNTVDMERGRQGGGSFVKDWKDFEVRKTDKGESRPVFDQPSSQFERFDVHATSLNPGIASHDPHHHRSEEVILMLKGM